ncbi:MAG: metal-dependent hydrolase [Chitinophagaceae bacterium]|nr:metal-dependent hydrolase [Chitinophagaceae bacterium]
MKLTYYGHACFSVELSGKHLLFDPFITPNELAKNIKLSEIKADYIFISHGHFDHIADCTEIARSTGAKVVSTWEICQWLGNQNLTDSHPMNTGGQWRFPEFSVKCTAAQHSSVLPDGTYGGNPVGFLILSDEGNFYYSGDTALTMDMQLIPRWAVLKAAILPVGDNFTMGYEDACLAAKMLECNKIIGVHFDTFGFIKIDHEKAVSHFSEAGIELILPAIGQSVHL